MGLKISDGDTLKKRVQITFDSAGHFNLFALKIKLWLGLSVVVLQSLDDQLLMSQDMTGLQSQRRNDAFKVENGEPPVAVQPQTKVSQAPPNDMYALGSQAVQASQSFQASQAQASQQAASQQAASRQAVSETVQYGCQMKPSSLSQNASQTDTFAAPGWQVNSPSHNPNSGLPLNNFTQVINHLLTAAQCLQAEATGVIPQADKYSTSQPSDPTWNSPFRLPQDGTQYTQVLDHDRTYNAPTNMSFPNVLSQASTARPEYTCLSQLTQRFDNSCFSTDRSKREDASPDATIHGAEKTLITEHDLRNALEDIPFEVPADGPDKRRTRSGSKMDGLLKKALEEVMNNDDGIEELDDMSLRLKIAQRLKSRSFRAFVKRVDKLVGDKLQ